MNRWNEQDNTSQAKSQSATYSDLLQQIMIPPSSTTPTTSTMTTTSSSETKTVLDRFDSGSTPAVDQAPRSSLKEKRCSIILPEVGILSQEHEQQPQGKPDKDEHVSCGLWGSRKAKESLLTDHSTCNVDQESRCSDTTSSTTSSARRRRVVHVDFTPTTPRRALSRDAAYSDNDDLATNCCKQKEEEHEAAQEEEEEGDLLGPLPNFSTREEEEDEESECIHTVQVVARPAAIVQHLCSRGYQDDEQHSTTILHQEQAVMTATAATTTTMITHSKDESTAACNDESTDRTGSSTTSSTTNTPEVKHEHGEAEQSEKHESLSNPIMTTSRVTRQRPSTDHLALIEIVRGVEIPFWGAEETVQAVASDQCVPTYCQNCNLDLFAIEHCQYIICNSCRAISPLVNLLLEQLGNDDNNTGGEGLGIGFTREDLQHIYHEIQTGEMMYT